MTIEQRWLTGLGLSLIAVGLYEWAERRRAQRPPSPRQAAAREPLLRTFVERIKARYRERGR